MGQKEMTVSGKNRIMIFGPKTDGTYVVEFRTAEGDVLANLDPKPRRPWSDTSRSGCPTDCSCRI